MSLDLDSELQGVNGESHVGGGNRHSEEWEWTVEVGVSGGDMVQRGWVSPLSGIGRKSAWSEGSNFTFCGRLHLSINRIAMSLPSASATRQMNLPCSYIRLKFFVITASPLLLYVIASRTWSIQTPSCIHRLIQCPHRLLIPPSAVS
jgi:hypothetical protein